MKLFICIFITVSFFCVSSFSQLKTSESSLLYKGGESSTAANTLVLVYILAVTPSLILEDGKAYFGLSKEFSVGKFPYGRAELDYTYIFRSERTSALHFSYNFDIPLNGNFSSPSLFMISPGAGYYTDLTRKGYFAQVALGLFASTGFSDIMAIHPNIKFRKIFVNNKLPGIFEVSVGVGFGIFSR